MPARPPASPCGTTPPTSTPSASASPKRSAAPVGSCLAGPAELITRARRFKQQVGGGFRQAGIIAAGALHALREHRPRLPETHASARRFAEGLAGLDGIDLDPETVGTNIVRFRLTRVPPAAFVDQAYERGVHLLPSGADGVRAVFYLDITREDVALAIAVAGKTLANL